MPLDQEQFKAIISGRRHDVPARLMRLALRIAALGYALGVSIRNALYDLGLLRARRTQATVLCVGNLTTGGTGKTPLVIWLVHHLTQKGLRVAILTRGYKSTANQKGRADNAHPTNADEPAELAAACPDVPVIVNPDRVAGAAEAVGKRKAQVLVMDDGFQHRRLARDLDIVTIDATNPFGYGRLLPAGLLREPPAGLRRARAAVLTRCNLVGEWAVSEIEAQALQINPDLIVARSMHAPAGLHYADGASHDLDALAGVKVFAFCGLGNPESFLQTIEACGGRLVGSRLFNDHHAYTQGDLAEVQRQAGAAEARIVLTSQKDWTKIAELPRPPGALPFAYLSVELRFTAGGESVRALIDHVLAGRMAKS